MNGLKELFLYKKRLHEIGSNRRRNRKIRAEEHTLTNGMLKSGNDEKFDSSEGSGDADTIEGCQLEGSSKLVLES